MEGVGGAGMPIAVLAIFALTLPVVAHRFVPGLVLHADMGAVAAMKQNLPRCLRNLYAAVSGLRHSRFVGRVTGRDGPGHRAVCRATGIDGLLLCDVP